VKTRPPATSAELRSIAERAIVLLESLESAIAAALGGSEVRRERRWWLERSAIEALRLCAIAGGAARDASLAPLARARRAWAVVERGAWAAHGGAPLAVHADGDASLEEHVQAMRAFHAPHPAGKIFLAWIGGGRGRAVVAAHRGYRVPAR